MQAGDIQEDGGLVTVLHTLCRQNTEIRGTCLLMSCGNVQAGDMQEDEVAVAEMRVRLLAGLKRYLHGKRLNGLLSSQVPFCNCSSSLFFI